MAGHGVVDADVFYLFTCVLSLLSHRQIYTLSDKIDCIPANVAGAAQYLCSCQEDLIMQQKLVSAAGQQLDICLSVQVFSRGGQSLLICAVQVGWTQ